MLINPQDKHTMAWVKDADLRYQEITTKAIERFAMPSADSVLGQDDYNLPWADFARCIRDVDEDVLAGNTVTSIHPTSTARGELMIISTYREPLYHEGIVSGIKGHAIEMPNSMKTVGLLTQIYNDHCLWGDSITHYEFASTNKKLKHYKISQRQFHVLFYLLRGKTAREISKILPLSIRTVQDYIEALKLKLHCDNKSQLIEKSLHLQLHAIF